VTTNIYTFRIFKTSFQLNLYQFSLSNSKKSYHQMVTKSFLPLLFLLLLVSQIGYAQVNEGIIKFKHTIYFETENMPAAASANMPNSVESFKKLTFTESVSKYEKDPDVIEAVTDDSENRSRMMRMFRDRSEKIFYKNIDEEIVLEQQGLFGKEFLISDTIQTFSWKLSAGEQKDILGYTCMKATYKDSIENLIVYFTPQITVPFGPEKYGELPGMILEIQSAKNHYIATSIDIKKLETPISKPSKGEAIERKKFNKLRDEKIKEQREMWGNRGMGRRN